MGLEPQLTHYTVVFPLGGIENSREDSKAWSAAIAVEQS